MKMKKKILMIEMKMLSSLIQKISLQVAQQILGMKRLMEAQHLEILDLHQTILLKLIHIKVRTPQH